MAHNSYRWRAGSIVPVQDDDRSALVPASTALSNPYARLYSDMRASLQNGYARFVAGYDAAVAPGRKRHATAAMSTANVVGTMGVAGLLNGAASLLSPPALVRGVLATVYLPIATYLVDPLVRRASSDAAAVAIVAGFNFAMEGVGYAAYLAVGAPAALLTASVFAVSGTIVGSGVALGVRRKARELSLLSESSLPNSPSQVGDLEKIVVDSVSSTPFAG